MLVWNERIGQGENGAFFMKVITSRHTPFTESTLGRFLSLFRVAPELPCSRYATAARQPCFIHNFLKNMIGSFTFSWRTLATALQQENRIHVLQKQNVGQKKESAAFDVGSCCWQLHNESPSFRLNHHNQRPIHCPTLTHIKHPTRSRIRRITTINAKHLKWNELRECFNLHFLWYVALQLHPTVAHSFTPQWEAVSLSYH